MELSKGKIKIEASFLLMAAGAVFFCGGEFALALLAAASVHEAGHLGAMALLGVPAEGLKADFSGARILYKGHGVDYAREAAICAAGPVVSLFFAVVSAGIGRFFSWRWWYTVSGMSAVLFAFNMLPISVLDGGGILRAVLLKTLKPETAERTGMVFDCIICAVLACFGIYAAFVGNFTVIICAFCAACACCKKGGYGVKF